MLVEPIYMQIAHTVRQDDWWLAWRRGQSAGREPGWLWRVSHIKEYFICFYYTARPAQFTLTLRLPLFATDSHVPETCSTDADADADDAVAGAADKKIKGNAAHNEAENLINCATVTWLSEG